MSFTKICVFIKTTHGLTYCEVYYPIKPTENNENGSELKTASTTILMVHGLGGSVEHWQQSELPMMLANQGHTVICFDWYSHGKSTRHSSKTTQHNLDFYFSQLFDIIHSPELPILQSKSFVAHGFSMGCYILLEYCVRFKPFSKRNKGTPPVAAVNTGTEVVKQTNEKATITHLPNTSDIHPVINKIILQSPWDGNFPSPLRGLLHVPLLLRLCKPADMAEIKSVRTLREILLSLNKGINYRQSLEAFADMVLHGADQLASTPGGIGEATDQPVCPVLVIVGTREPPFAVTARRIVKRIVRKDSAQSTATATSKIAAPSTSTTNSGDDNCSSSSEVKVPAVTYRSCKYAGHMSFAKAARDSYVRTFFHREIAAFINLAHSPCAAATPASTTTVAAPLLSSTETTKPSRDTGNTTETVVQDNAL